MLRDLLYRVRALFRRNSMEAEMDAELRAHIEQQAETYVQAGMSPKEAARRARLEFGGIEQVKEECRDSWGVRFIAELAQDLRYGLRQLRRNPGFTAVAILTLALGIGANTAVFSVVNAVMLMPLPVKNPTQLELLEWVSQNEPVGLFESTGRLSRDATGRLAGLSFPYPSFEQFAKGNQVFSSFFGFDSFATVNINAEGRSNVAEGELVSGDYFSGLGVKPILGRAIAPEDEKPGAPRVVVISYGCWSLFFGRSPAAVGRGITVNGVPFTVIGVAPPEFSGVTPGRAVGVWIPLVHNTRIVPWSTDHLPGESSPFTSPTWWWLQMMGRLKPGVTAQQAEAQLDVLFQHSRAALNVAASPQSIPHLRLESGAQGITSLREKFSTSLWVLTVIVGVVLLIACTNVAALLLARSATRNQEIAIRLSLGASRARLVRQLLSENVLLAGLGGALGVLFAHWASHSLVLLMSSGGQPLDLVVQLDARVLEFTTAVSIVTGILFGLAPALRSARAGLAPALKGGTGGARSSGRRRRIGLASPLVATQIVLALLLAISAGLFVRTLEGLGDQKLGFNKHNLLLLTVNPERNGYKGERLMGFYSQLRARLQALPGVESASMSLEPPIYGNEFIVNVPVSVEGYKAKLGGSPWADLNTVGPSFFETLEIPLMMGRGIELRDTAASRKVAVINQAFAREAFRGRNPIGQSIRFETFKYEGKPEFRIVGMVRDARFKSIRQAPRPTIYVPYSQMPSWAALLTFELRTSGNPLALVSAARGAVHNLDPDVPISDVKTQTRQIAEALTQERLFGLLSSFFGALAVLLACIGLYGVISYSVNQRTREIGIRMALGAKKGDVLRMVIWRGLKLALIGVAIGISGALGLTRFLSSLLYGVRPTDPLTFVAVSLILIAVALLACYLPARRAAKVDPMVALRYE